MKATLLVVLLCLLMAPFVKTDPTQEAIEVIEGILVGAFGEVGHDVKTCISDGEQIFLDVEAAVKQFELGTTEGIIQGIIKIGEAIQLIPEEIKDCEAVVDLVKDFERIAQEFLVPEELIIHIGEEIFWHGRSIFHDVTDCTAQFRSGNYEKAGEDIGDIIYILFLKLAPQDVVVDAEQFLEGFFKGALEDDSFEINDCITDGTVVIEELEKIIEDFKNGMTSDIEKLFLDLIDLISESVASVAQCEKAPAELEIMLQWEEDLKDLKKMESKLFDAFLYYPDRIKEDSKDMIDSFKDHVYGTSGFCLGDYLHILFIEVNGADNEDYLDDAFQFLTGFYSKGFNINLKLDTCEADIEDEWHLVEKAINELEHLSFSEIKQGVEDLLHAIPQFVHAFEACEEDWPDLERGLVIMSEFIQKPTQIPWAVTKAMSTHPFRVESDCSEMYHAFHDSPHNFRKGGEGGGDLTALLLSELKAALSDSRIVEEIK